MGSVGSIRGKRRVHAAAVGLALLCVPIAAGQAGAARPRASLYPLPAPAVQPEPCPPPPIKPGPPAPPLPKPAVPEVDVPIVKPPAPRRVALAPISGKGMWLTTWSGQTVDVDAVVSEASAAGLQELYVRTGSSTDGFYGGPLLRALVPVAHRAGISVVAWDFPTLSDPALDAERAADAFASGADAFSPDIEEAPEGTYLTARRVADYLSLVRRDAGDRPVIATVPRPLGPGPFTYPYATEAPFVDAFAPMVYWSCTEPGTAVSVAIAALSKLRPVAPIGQDYNMASEGGRVGLPSGREIWRFLDVSMRLGAIGASLYDLESGGRPQLQALSAYPWPSTRSVGVLATS